MINKGNAEMPLAYFYPQPVHDVFLERTNKALGEHPAEFHWTMNVSRFRSNEFWRYSLEVVISDTELNDSVLIETCVDFANGAAFCWEITKFNGDADQTKIFDDVSAAIAWAFSLVDAPTSNVEIVNDVVAPAVFTAAMHYQGKGRGPGSLTIINVMDPAAALEAALSSPEGSKVNRS